MYDADNTDGAYDVRFHGGTVPAPWAGSTSIAIAEYDSDGSVNRDGFAGTYTCVDPSTITPPAPNPCTTGVSLTDSGTFGVCDGCAIAYENGMDCRWALTCSDGTLAPTVTFTTFGLETGWDFVYMYDGTDWSGSADATLHGTDMPTPLSATGADAVVRFTSDGSVTNGPGFQLDFTCAAPITPPAGMCANTELMVDWVGGFHASGHALFGGQDVHAPSLESVLVIIADPLDGCMGGADGAAAATADLTGNFVGQGMAGKIALIRRGVCFFTTKAMNAQNAGAVAAVIYNDHRVGTVTMSGPEIGVTIPAVFIDGVDGDALNAAVTADASTTLSIHCGAASIHGAPADPCAGGVFLVDAGDVTHGSMNNNQACTWTMSCTDAAMAPRLTVVGFETEGG